MQVSWLARHRLVGGSTVIGVCVLVAFIVWLSSDRIASTRSSVAAADVAAQVDAVAGFTKIATTAHYFVVVNVLPAERMYSPEELAAEHPTVGEAVLRGPAAPVVPSARHIEAHIYDRTTGLPTTLVTPTITVVDHDSGARISIDPTLMQDVIIGAADVHFGNNVVVAGDRDITLTVDIGGEEVVVSGRLD